MFLFYCLHNWSTIGPLLNILVTDDSKYPYSLSSETPKKLEKYVVAKYLKTNTL